MLLAYQVPVCDARLFSAGAASSRLRRPDWPTPTPGDDFVRSFGPVARRRRGGHEEFHDEAAYADARGAVRFDRLEQRPLGHPPRSLRPAVAYRRLLCSGRETGAAVIRFELGLANRLPPHGAAAAEPLEGQDAVAVALDLLELPLTVRQTGAVRVRSSPWTLGKPLAELYQRATSPSGQAVSDADRRLVAPGQPLLLLEYDAHEIATLPTGAKAVDPARIGGLDLSFVWIDYRRRPFGLWFLRYDRERADLCRRLRLGLFRLHAEHQVLKRALSLLLAGEIEYVRGSSAANLFDAYLAAATRVLARQEHGGFSHAAIQEVVAAYDAVVNPDELALLSQRLEQVRRQIRVKVEGYSAPSPAAPAAAGAVGVEAGETIRVFVSYSHADAAYIDEADKNSLLGYLKGLERERFRFWHDERIGTGEQWNDRIREEIDVADVALVLVSQAFLNSPYCVGEEVARFLQAVRDRHLTVYPIVLSACDWKSHAWLAATQFQPGQGRTVESDYAEPGKRKQLYLEILEELRVMGQRIRAVR
jgi:hypothetical protein